MKLTVFRKSVIVIISAVTSIVCISAVLFFMFHNPPIRKSISLSQNRWLRDSDAEIDGKTYWYSCHVSGRALTHSHFKWNTPPNTELDWRFCMILLFPRDYAIDSSENIPGVPSAVGWGYAGISSTGTSSSDILLEWDGFSGLGRRYYFEDSTNRILIYSDYAGNVRQLTIDMNAEVQPDIRLLVPSDSLPCLGSNGKLPFIQILEFWKYLQKYNSQSIIIYKNPRPCTETLDNDSKPETETKN